MPIPSPASYENIVSFMRENPETTGFFGFECAELAETSSALVFDISRKFTVQFRPKTILFRASEDHYIRTTYCNEIILGLLDACFRNILTM